MAQPQDLPLFPLAGWEIGPIKTMPAVILRLAYLATPADDPAKPNLGIRHVLTPGQARELAEALLEQARLAETGGS